MEDNQRLEMLKHTVGISESFRRLESWESVEARSILTEVKRTSEALERSGFLQSEAWNELRENVQKIEDGIASGELKPDDFRYRINQFADYIDNLTGICLMNETLNVYEEAKKQHDWELAKNSASKIKALYDLWPESIFRRDPKSSKKLMRSSLQYRTELEVVDKDHVLNVFPP